MVYATAFANQKVPLLTSFIDMYCEKDFRFFSKIEIKAQGLEKKD